MPPQADDRTSATAELVAGTPTGFYRRVMQTLARSQVPYLVGGAYALAHYTGVPYRTKDFDLFLKRADVPRAQEALESAGFPTSLVFSHFLAKVHEGPSFVDLIFGSGNGIAAVDDQWFDYSVRGEVFGIVVSFCPIEEIIWSKAFIMERERFDGGDISHVLLATAERLDWPRLLERFGPHWRVLLAHLILFGFVYPGRRSLIPPTVLGDLLQRLRNEPSAWDEEDLCRGGLLSRMQYMHDLSEMGMRDARLAPDGSMTREEIDAWTEAAEAEEAEEAEEGEEAE
ncbi:MAG: hypothetical protein AB7O32_06055 [Vicinamibacterales bacterium]